MISDLLSQINEVLESEDNQEGSGQDGQGGGSAITVGDIINNQGTIIIGGSPDSGRSTGGDSEPDIDPAQACAEVRDLHQQITRLKHRLTCLYGTCVKRCSPRRRACLNSNGHEPANTSLSQSIPGRSHSQRATAKPRATTGSTRYNPPQPTLTRLVSILVAPNRWVAAT